MTTLDPFLDLFPLLAGTLAAVTCGLLGNFLVLRRLSLMGDAISHSVLPGLVIAFLLTATRGPMLMFVGAAISGVVTVVLVEMVKKLGRVEPGAAMGVVFSVMFAAGVLLIERADASGIDLDADCVLHGQLETLVWFDAPTSWGGIWNLDTVRAMPRPVVTLLVMCGLAFALVGALFKELRLAAFDPGLATSLGFHAGLLHYVLMVFVAAATVAAFEAVGSILVIAMLVCPAASARLLTDRLKPQLAWSVVFAVGAGVGGYVAATVVPAWFGLDSVNAAGAMAAMGGVLLVVAIVASPRHGLLAKAWRARKLARQIAVEDVVVGLMQSQPMAGGVETAGSCVAELPGWMAAKRRGLRAARSEGMVRPRAGDWELTDAGRVLAADVAARRSSWERVLIVQAGLAADHIADTAERLEHVPIELRSDVLRDD